MDKNLSWNEGDNWGQMTLELNRQYGLSLSENLSRAECEATLEEKINGMILSDFSGLVQLLYRIDVDENRLRAMLQTRSKENAGRIIANLILDRQLQKMQNRRAAGGSDQVSGEDRW